jgi:hypothetical protein
MSACNCVVINNSGLTIQSLVLMHDATEIPSSGSDFSTVMQIANLANGATSAVASTPQNDDLDWWAAGVLFEGNATPYFLANDVLPFAECNVPGGGSMQLIIQGSAAVGYGAQINTYSNSNFTDSDGDCSEQVVTQAQLDAENELAEEIIEIILEALL